MVFQIMKECSEKSLLLRLQ